MSVSDPFQHALESLTISVGVLDSNGSFIYANRALRKLLDAAYGTGAGVAFPEIIAEELWVKDFFDKMNAGQEWLRRLTLADGRGFWFAALPNLRQGQLHSISLTASKTCHAGHAHGSNGQCTLFQLSPQELRTKCHALSQPATVLMGSIELLRANCIAESSREALIEMCYESVLQLREELKKINN